MTELNILLRGFKLADDFYFNVNPERIGLLPSCQPCCSRSTPQVTYLEAKYILSSMLAQSEDIYLKSMSWMVKPHEGLKSYQRIRGRMYTHEEAVDIEKDVDVVKNVACPFFDEIRGCFLSPYRPFVCCVEGLDSQSKKKAKYFREQMKRLFKNVAPELGVVGFLPTMIVRERNKDELASLVDKGEIADAKLAISQQLPVFWEE